MNMPRPSMLWIYGLIGAFIIGWYVFGDVNDTPLPSDWTTVREMVEKGDVEKIQVVNRDQAQVFLKKEAAEQYRRDTVDKRFKRLPETGVQLTFTIGSVDSFREDLKNYEVTFQSEQALVLHDSITAFESSLFVAAINFLNRATVSSFYNTLRRAHSFIHSEPFQHVSESLFLTETTCM